MPNNYKKVTSPPNLLRGIVSLVIFTVVSILGLTWFIINSQVEQLVTQRTSEYAHSIARIAADSSSEALLADDVLQLNLLVENVAKDPYIRQATIYSEDGIVVSQYPAENPARPKSQAMLETQQQVAGEIEGGPASTTADDKAQVPKTQRISSKQFILRQKNIPFIEPIVYQDITAGWFKIEIDSHLLGQKFRDAYFEIQLFSAGIAFAFLLIMLILLFRFELSIKTIAQSCHHLLMQHKIKPESGKKAWINALKELSEQHPQQLKEHTILPAAQVQWQQHTQVKDALVCVLEFEINYDESADLAHQLSLAEQYLNKAIQAYGVQSQGDILTGCIVPFISANPSHSDPKNAITSALSFMALVKSLLSQMGERIQMKACIARAPILLLEDDHDLITGVALLQGNAQTLKQWMQAIELGETISLFIAIEELAQYVNCQAFAIGTTTDSRPSNLNGLKLLELTPELQQQIARKRQYISQA